MDVKFTPRCRSEHDPGLIPEKSSSFSISNLSVHDSSTTSCRQEERDAGKRSLSTEYGANTGERQSTYEK